MSKRAIITGIAGQDGSYLAELLLQKGYTVVGMVRRSGAGPSDRIAHLLDRMTLRTADLLDQKSLIDLIHEVRPHEIYNLASPSFVQTSWEQPVLTAEYTALGVTRLLEAIRLVDSEIRFYQASTGEMFGKAQETPQHERTPFCPRTPYGVAKLYSHWMTISYRERYGLFACSGILFNHESPRRGKQFVTRKVTDGVARIKHGLSAGLPLGNLDVRRDWGYAGDYVQAMWLTLQQERPEDLVIATGETHTVRELVEIAFARAGLDWQKYVVEDPALKRPAEITSLHGNASKAKQVLGWHPTVSFRELIEMMVDADLEQYSHSAPAKR